MTAWSNSFNGVASGTTVTTSNSGGVSGTAFNFVPVPTGGSLTAQSTAAHEGDTGLQIVYPATSAQGYVNWSGLAGTTGTRVSFSCWHRFSATPTASDHVLYIGSAAIRVTSTGQYAATDGGTTPATFATASATTPGSWSFIQFAATVGTTTGNGRVEARIFKEDGTTLLSYDSGTTANVGTSSITNVYFGRFTATTQAYTSSYDMVAASNVLTSGFPGDPAPLPSYAPGQFLPFF